MKQIFLIAGIFFYISSPLLADKNSAIALELTRAQKIDNVISRINSVNRYINQYILDTADKNPTQSKLIDYFGISSKIFKDFTYESDFSVKVVGKKVVYDLVIPPDLSQQQIKFYKFSQNLHPQAVVGDDLGMEISLDPKAQFVISQLDKIPGNGVVLTSEPADTTKYWYKPDGQGGFTIYAYNAISSSWEVLDNSGSKKQSVSQTKKSVILNNKTELMQLKAKEGDIAFVNKDDEKVDKYIYSGSTWLIESSASDMSTDSSCTSDNVGVISYSMEKDCMQRCVVNDINSSWECIENIAKQNSITVYNSCYAIKQAKPSSQDGTYTIDPDGKGGEAPFEAYCDMTTAGGGGGQE